MLTIWPTPELHIEHIPEIDRIRISIQYVPSSTEHKDIELIIDYPKAREIISLLQGYMPEGILSNKIS